MDALVANDLLVRLLVCKIRMTSAFSSQRAQTRARLDSASDYVVTDGMVGFRQTFETIEDAETFPRAPDDVVDAGRRLLTIDVARGLSAIVNDTVVVEIGCSRVPSL